MSKILFSKPIHFVGFVKRKCPNCEKEIYIDTMEIKEKGVWKCIKCNTAFLIKLTKQ